MTKTLILGMLLLAVLVAGCSPVSSTGEYVEDYDCLEYSGVESFYYFADYENGTLELVYNSTIEKAYSIMDYEMDLIKTMNTQDNLEEKGNVSISVYARGPIMDKDALHFETYIIQGTSHLFGYNKVLKTEFSGSCIKWVKVYRKGDTT